MTPVDPAGSPRADWTAYAPRRTLDCEQPVPTIPAATDPRPQWLELDDGTRCTLRRGGAWGGRSDDLRGAYSCKNTDQVVLTEYGTYPIDRSSPWWTGPLGTGNPAYPPPDTHGVAKAYFSASP